MNKNEQKLRELAQNDPVMHQLLRAYDHQQWESWEAFLVDCVLTMASVKNALHKEIEEHLSKGVPPIVLNVTPGEAENILNQIKR